MQGSKGASGSRSRCILHGATASRAPGKARPRSGGARRGLRQRLRQPGGLRQRGRETPTNQPSETHTPLPDTLHATPHMHAPHYEVCGAQGYHARCQAVWDKLQYRGPCRVGPRTRTTRGQLQPRLSSERTGVRRRAAGSVLRETLRAVTATALLAGPRPRGARCVHGERPGPALPLVTPPPPPRARAQARALGVAWQQLPGQHLVTRAPAGQRPARPPTRSLRRAHRRPRTRTRSAGTARSAAHEHAAELRGQSGHRPAAGAGWRVAWSSVVAVRGAHVFVFEDAARVRGRCACLYSTRGGVTARAFEAAGGIMREVRRATGRGRVGRRAPPAHARVGLQGDERGNGNGHR
jgi:hypothetical protein